MSNNILFLDIEADRKTKKIYELGLIIGDDELKTSSIDEAKRFVEKHTPQYIAGYNIVDFDTSFIFS